MANEELRSKRKRSVFASESSPVRFVAEEVNATYRPEVSVETDGEDESPFGCPLPVIVVEILSIGLKSAARGDSERRVSKLRETNLSKFLTISVV